MPMLGVDGSSLYYTVKGNGIPIVFIHPPVLTSVNFEYQVEELAQKFQVITFDIRGHGRSQSSKQSLTYPLIVEDIRCLLDHLNIKRAFICGYSTGSSIALEFLLNYAERSLGGILIGGMSEVKDNYLKNKISLGMTLAKARAIHVLALSIAWSNSNTQKLFIKMFTEARKGNAKNIEQYYRYSLYYNCTNQLRKIKLPVLLVYGKEDKPFYGYAKLLYEKLPCNKLNFINNVKHQIPTKAARDLNEMIKQFATIHDN
ncbi:MULTISPECIES: alpha/beta fold hydrolase [unclassified Bacillus (in: firmicutes)]|uniref:alpha/beta fold hydrolase n=1 Tax=unclassified Bacillus (in: firmicutes) TaxID=185979 RepID=UPI0008F3B1C8|nr:MULTISPECIES: alpha/beta hydrolase [unclassified Bacillus (in: firmicutes)]SFI51657.1 Pimeloyl-ACP methyl ester carboxylesterase [Bacillus sp. 71mf]SFS48391.1 Pimeloyl-ACP methyl ester carboxylesterase [Bacillus sp. 103mf]